MDMHVFQVESNKVLPQQGSILISSPFMNDYHFTRAVVLLIYKPQNKMFRFYKTFCSKITLVNTIQNVILNPI